MATTLRFKRRVTGSPGAPSTLKTAEIAYNMVDKKLYVGFGDDGSGNATSIKAFAADDFVVNLPSGGVNGKLLGFEGGEPVWRDAPTQTTYTAGSGLTLTGAAFSVDTAVVVTQSYLSSVLATLATDSELASAIATKANVSHVHAAADITSGTLAAARMPALTGDITTTAGAVATTLATVNANVGSFGSATQVATFTINAKGLTTAASNVTVTPAWSSITSKPTTLSGYGITDAAAVSHTHAAADVTSGTFATARIPDLDAAKITTGVLDVARIPVMPSQTSQVSAGAIANLTAPQQAAIDVGTVVTTTDGRRWVYNTGSKTAEASYVELADVTPEWTAVANKPSFATVATSGSYADLSNKPTISTAGATGAYADLTGKPTLGTMSSQAASAVAITGGTIDGVTLDGGTF